MGARTLGQEGALAPLRPLAMTIMFCPLLDKFLWAPIKITETNDGRHGRSRNIFHYYTNYVWLLCFSGRALCHRIWQIGRVPANFKSVLPLFFFENSRPWTKIIDAALPQVARYIFVNHRIAQCICNLLPLNLLLHVT